ncbi:putative orphan protein [Vibrio ishigakensis]|uniref:Putative orphan protein n=1 Tax=Vibrio ishigakensis TaxID=1481914 RepID=A0A0B8Q5M4_9VIBR|nr:putative orphan protein [Vibrio ishigakensis]
MSRQITQGKRNRGQNSGGASPEALDVAVKLMIAMERIHRKGDSDMVCRRKQVTFLIWWFTGALVFTDSMDELPNCIPVAGNADCLAYGLRIILMDGESWVDFGLRYHCDDKGAVHWQPVPAAFNALFLSVIRNSPRGKALLTEPQHAQLIEAVQKTWKTLPPLSHLHAMRKDSFFRYWIDMIRTDPELSALAKRTLLPKTFTHHHHADNYQRANTNQLRYQIFKAHNRGLYRLAKLSSFINYQGRLQLASSGDVTMPSYLKRTGAIPSFVRKQGRKTYSYIELPAVEYGSCRALHISGVRAFFARLRSRVDNARTRLSSKADLISYHNWRTYQIAFLFLILTGVRPNHAISIEKAKCFDYRDAIVTDKGQPRPIWLCDFLQHALKEYVAMQHIICHHLGLSPTSPWLWYLLDDEGSALELSRSKLTHVLNELWEDSSTRIDLINCATPLRKWR